VRLSEETKNPKKTIPLVLSLSVAISTAMSFGFGVFLLCSMGRFDKLVNTTLGAVYLQLYVNAIGLKAGLAVATTIMVLLAIFVASQVMTASSRLIWAMARQQGVPFSVYFAHVEPKVDVPLRALVASFVAILLLGLL
jgi:amino acid transporter